MKARVLFLILICSYLAIIFPFTSYMKNKPFVEKIGYSPAPVVLKILAADQHGFVASSLIMKVIFYYGGLVEQAMNKVIIPPEYPEMQQTVESAVKLDPYNMDAYYFDQAIMVWGAGQVRATNELLEYGMQYRSWDFYLPYFSAFNYAYFLKDYENAAKYYKRVADLTGDVLLINLSGRYLYESGRTDLAIGYLSVMSKSATNEAIRKTLQTRLQAFEGIRKIEQAEDSFKKKLHRPPRSVEELIQKRYLTELPVDPYGGKFYIDQEDKVRSTSKFAFGVAGLAR
jgi:tetratricopeptide (TPR) repeat protein